MGFLPRNKNPDRIFPSLNKMRKVICCRQLNIKFRIRILLRHIWPIAMYGCEAWSFKNDIMRRLEVFETWYYRHMLHISWTQKIGNDTFFQRVHMPKKLIQTIKSHMIKYLRNILCCFN